MFCRSSAGLQRAAVFCHDRSCWYLSGISSSAKSTIAARCRLMSPIIFSTGYSQFWTLQLGSFSRSDCRITLLRSSMTYIGCESPSGYSSDSAFSLSVACTAQRRRTSPKACSEHRRLKAVDTCIQQTLRWWPFSLRSGRLDSAARLVLNLDLQSYITSTLHQLHWLPVKFRIILKNATLMHQILRNRCSSSLTQSCTRVQILRPDPTKPGKGVTRPDPQAYS